jgi:hypothetical protein
MKQHTIFYRLGFAALLASGLIMAGCALDAEADGSGAVIQSPPYLAVRSPIPR